MNTTSTVERGRPLTFCPSCSRSRSPSRRNGSAADERKREWSSFTCIPMQKISVSKTRTQFIEDENRLTSHKISTDEMIIGNSQNSVHARSAKLYENMYGSQRLQQSTQDGSSRSLNSLHSDDLVDDHNQVVSDDAASSFGENSPSSPFTSNANKSSYFEDKPFVHGVHKRYNVSSNYSSSESISSSPSDIKMNAYPTKFQDGSLSKPPVPKRRRSSLRLASIQRGSALVLTAIIMTILVHTTVEMLGTEILVVSS